MRARRRCRSRWSRSNPKAVVVGDCGRVKSHGADAVPGSIQTAAAWSWRLLLIGLGVTAALYLLAMFKLIVVPVALGDKGLT